MGITLVGHNQLLASLAHCFNSLKIHMFLPLFPAPSNHTHTGSIRVTLRLPFL